MIRKKVSPTQIIGMLALTIVVGMMACSWSVKSDTTVGSVQVDGVTVSDDFDLEKRLPVNIATTFPATVKRLYLSFDLETNQEIPLTTLWYHEDKMVKKQEGKLTTGKSFSWVEPAAGETFQTGHYKVEILWQDMVLAKTEFTVE